VAAASEVLRKARRHRQLTQSELAAISGVEQPNISAIESARRAPSADTLLRLLHSCGFELVATAGSVTLSISADEGSGSVGDQDPPVELAPDVRQRMMVAVLDTAETIVRSR
jgi:transcriptional regulator with XRE-family HTH domain